MDLKNNPCPCIPDCPKRVLGCRPTCEEFQADERKRFAEYEEKRMEYQTSGTLGHEQTSRYKLYEDHRHGR